MWHLLSSWLNARLKEITLIFNWCQSFPRHHDSSLFFFVIVSLLSLKASFRFKLFRGSMGIPEWLRLGFWNSSPLAFPRDGLPITFLFSISQGLVGQLLFVIKKLIWKQTSLTRRQKSIPMLKATVWKEAKSHLRAAKCQKVLIYCALCLVLFLTLWGFMWHNCHCA